MEVISNDFVGQPRVMAAEQGVNDHLQPILDYLRQDGGNEANAQPAQNTFPHPQSPHGFLLRTATLDDDVIDLTSDDDTPIIRPANNAVFIDLAETPPLFDERESGNTRMNFGQNDPHKLIKTESGAIEWNQAQLKDQAHENCSNCKRCRSDAGSSSNLTLLCPVCLDSFEMIKAEGQRQLISTKCGHVFCSSCIDDIMRKHKCCPSCRTAIRKPSLRAIFL